MWRHWENDHILILRATRGERQLLPRYVVRGEGSQSYKDEMV